MERLEWGVMNLILEVNYNNQFLICMSWLCCISMGYKSGLQSMFIIDTKFCVQLHIILFFYVMTNAFCCSSFSSFYSSIRVE